MKKTDGKKYGHFSDEIGITNLQQATPMMSAAKADTNARDLITEPYYNASTASDHEHNVVEFESEFAEYCGVPHAIATKSGISAIYSVLMAAGIGPGDEVIVPAFASNSVISTISMCGAMPVIADVDPRQFTINGQDADRKVSTKTKAIIGTDNFGQPFEAETLRDLCVDRDLILIEEASQAIGARARGRYAGSLGDIGFFILPSGEGAVITTGDDDFERKIRHHLAEEIDNSSAPVSTMIGSRWFETMQENIERRIRNAETYDTFLQTPGILTPYRARRTLHAYNHYVVTITPLSPMTRDDTMDHLSDNGFTATIPAPLPLLPIIRPEDCPVAALLSGCILSLPVYPEITSDRVKHLCEVLNETLYT